MRCSIEHGIRTHCGKPGGGECSVTPAKPRPPLLGDRTEQMLASIGITEEYYTEVKKRFGLAPKCSCGIRKKYLNRVDEWFRAQTLRDKNNPR